MKICPNCRNQIQDESVYCPVCGSSIGTAPQFTPQQSPTVTTEYTASYTQPPVYTSAPPYVDPFDHTSDFSAADIAENKIYAMAIYLLGPLGIIIALLAAKDSGSIRFHVLQGLKLTVAEILGLLAMAVTAFLMWSLRMRVLMLFVIAAAVIGLVVIHLLCVLQVIKNKVKEVYLVRKLRFLQ